MSVSTQYIREISIRPVTQGLILHIFIRQSSFTQNVIHKEHLNSLKHVNTMDVFNWFKHLDVSQWEYHITSSVKSKCEKYVLLVARWTMVNAIQHAKLLFFLLREVSRTMVKHWFDTQWCKCANGHGWWECSQLHRL